tara:strand:- start:6699 stop:7316 length:618 start_codon:yes stop_codon:yes gene_type:complete
MKANPKLQLYFSTSVERAPSTNLFKKWFKNSHVVTDDGEPLICFHATAADIPDGGFRPLTHFGSAAAAKSIFEKRLAQHMMYGPPSQPKNFRTYPVVLNLQNPLRIRDIGSDWNVYFYRELCRLSDKININQNELTDIFMDDENWCARMISKLRACGYDGFEYINKAEDPGSLSYMIFSAAQVRPAFASMSVTKDRLYLSKKMRP